MPRPAKPKQFVAARDFTHAGRAYRVGDPIEDRRMVARLLAKGNGFIRSAKPAPAEPSAEASAATPTAESTQED